MDVQQLYPGAVLAAGLLLAGCSAAPRRTTTGVKGDAEELSMEQEKRMANEDDLHTIYLAGGCFWGVEAYLQKLPGVCGTDVGYANSIWRRSTTRTT